MRVCLQRVSEAWVSVIDESGDRRETGRIGRGLLALAGFAPGDGPEDLRWMAAKIADLRVFAGEGPGGFDRSLRETAGGILVVSQFTLYGDARKGRRPDFTAAAPFPEAESLYLEFCALCAAELPGRVETGEFGARMEVGLVNDGPVTLWLER
ncbi:MAG TPA: D-aminoacyl-tRNA deacylase [Gemmatimonadota bacterium]|jgi:D-tyrosyl-tRNA(Tyr) deacylase|nr:D-aminoacyl-tRNA deacylase [Gemmatimonadota bacterium]